MGRTRREVLGATAIMAGGIGLPMLGGRSRAQAPADCATVAAVDATCAPLLALLPEAALRGGAFDTATARRCDDLSADGSAALAHAVAVARDALPASCDAPFAASARALLDAATLTHDIHYGRNDPTASIHRPYRVTPFTGPQIETVTALALWQPVADAAALDGWQAKLDGLADALLAAAQALRIDEGRGCLPPQTMARATLQAMDGFILAAPSAHPLVLALIARLRDPAVREPAAARAAATLERRVQPAMALLRDTMAALTRKGRAEPGVWTQPGGDMLHAANVARAADTRMSLDTAMQFGRDEAARVAALLDRRLAARGLKTGTIAERIAGAFAARPAFVAADDAAGRESLRAAARDRIETAHALLGKLVPPALAATPPLELSGLPDLGAGMPGGSFYTPAIAATPATLWFDDRSVFALPIPGVAPLAYHLGLPGAHLLASAGRGAARARLVAIAAWPAMTAGWAGYAERLASEQGLFARDPWGDIARLSDELLRAARLVVDIGIHRDRWTRAQAKADMIRMTGGAQGPAIDRIIALPGEAARDTLGLHHLLDLRAAAKAKAGRGFDLRSWHATVLADGARPFELVATALG